MIGANKLIAWFQYMYDNGWGYIWGKSGQTWTEAMQAKATNEMAVKYGKRWIGHRVTDCSGAFVWAYKQEGETIYHGSNTIYKSSKYTSARGELKNGVRADGEPIKPGTAVFLYDKEKKNYHHIGLYIGGDMCIEAKGTLYGVVTSRLNHWDNWAELAAVDYSMVEPVDPPKVKRTLRKGCKGDDVKELQEALNKWNAGFEALKVDGSFGKLTETAVKLFQNDKELKVDGIVGPQTWEALEPYMELPFDDEPTQKIVKMAVTIAVPDDYKYTYMSIFEEWLDSCPFTVKEWSVIDNA